MDDLLKEILSDDRQDSGSSSVTVELAAAKPKTQSSAQQEEGQLTLDVYQTSDDIIIKSTVAGVDPKTDTDSLDISITNEMVTIKGKRELGEKISSKNYYHQELFWGRFARSILLPEEIDPDGATATLKNGILTITLPKVAKKRTRKLKIS